MVVNVYSVKVATRVLNAISSLKFVLLVSIVIMGIYKLIRNGGWMGGVSE